MANAPRTDYIDRSDARFGRAGLHYPTPNIDDIIFIEEIAVRDGIWQALPYGTLHPRNPNARLVFQGDVTGNDGFKIPKRVYSTTRQAQDVYNYTVSYEQQDGAYPMFARTYIELRSEAAADPLTVGNPLLGVYKVRMTNNGSGYDPSNPPTVSASGGTGSGFSGTAIVSLGGTVSGIKITALGNYSVEPTITIAAPSSGTTATCTAYVQPQTCVLVKQSGPIEFVTKRQESGAIEPEIAALFVIVNRLYMTLPGPVQTSLIVDPETKQIMTATTQTVRDGTVTPSMATAGGLETIKDEVVSKEGIVSERIKETVPNASLNSMGWVEYEDIHYTFPTLFENYSYIVGLGGVWNFRSSISMLVKAKVTYIFRDGDAEEGVTPDVIYGVGWSLPFGFSMRDALTNGESFSYTVGGVTYGPFTLPASTPSRATYEASWIGAYKIIGGSTKRWKGNVFVTKKIEVKMI